VTVYTKLDVDTLARTLYGEARGEGIDGMHAVAHVPLNRLKNPGWWTREQGDGIPDDTVAAACRDPYQFSTWNAGNPNRDLIQKVTLDDPVFQKAYGVAIAVLHGLGGFGEDPANGATHYHTVNVSPSWAEGREPVKRVGDHLFYTDI